MAEKPEFAGTVKFVETHDFVRTEKESPTGEAHHEFKNGETCFLIGEALGKGMLKLQSNDAGGPSASPNFARPALLWGELEK